MAHHLSSLFEPRSVAVFGASDHEGSVGAQLVKNLVDGGFAGEVYFINPRHTEIEGRRCWPSLAEAHAQVDLAIVATPASTVQAIVRDCGAADVRAMIVLSAGFGEAGPEGAKRQRELAQETQRFGIHLLGPNCLGLLCTKSKLNATFADIPVRSGGLALVSQSGAICSAVLDWAQDTSLGFSSVVSLGDAAGVGFGRILDYLSTDPATKAILVYVEGVRDARQFMSGLRMAARFKPTIVLKAGKHPLAARAAHSHTGAIVGGDDVFDAALRRAGAVRVDSIGQLFAAAQLLGSGHRTDGDRLAIVTNAGGPGVMAADCCEEVGVALSELSSSTLESLSEFLPSHWSGGNPVDILGDAGASQYRQAVQACLADPGVHGVLVMLTPQAMTHPTQCAQAVVDAAAGQSKPTVACWMGGPQVAAGRELLRLQGVPVFNTPEASISAFQHLWAFHQNQRLLLRSVDPMSYVPHHDVVGARLIVERALKEGRHELGSVHSKAIVTAFGIHCSMPVAAATADEALVVAENLGLPVAMKIDSPDLSHKSDAGGVVLGIEHAEEVGTAFANIMERARAAAPNAQIRGVTVERMYSEAHPREVMIGVVRDPCFGPAISVGAGGVLVELIGDKAVGLPPLNPYLAREMIQRTALHRLLGKFRGWPAADMNAIEEVLARVSDLVSEIPEIVELDINPLMASDNGALAVDVRISLSFASPGARPYEHMAVHPYPRALLRQRQLVDGTTVVIRPIRPEDATTERAFIKALSSESKYFRFMSSIAELTPEMLARFTQLDYDREMAFLALVQTKDGEREIGVSRYQINQNGTSAEFSLVVADEWHSRGVGTHLMQALFDAARARGVSTLEGEVLRENHDMLALVRNLGFIINDISADSTVVLASKHL